MNTRPADVPFGIKKRHKLSNHFAIEPHQQDGQLDDAVVSVRIETRSLNINDGKIGHRGHL